MFAERLIRARKAAGLSMSALAKKVDISANAIKKYEHGINMPSSGKLYKLSKALGVRSEYFFRPTKVKLSGIEYRKRASTPQKTLDRIKVDELEQAEQWAELLEFYPDSVRPVPKFKLPENLPEKVNTAQEIELIADQMREEWNLGFNPIPDMIDTLESKGIMIICTTVEVDNNLDGLAGNIDGTPVVVVSTHQPGDRQRFTFVHELGHLVLHGRLPEGMDEEKACNHFAGALLLPKKAIGEHLGKTRRAIGDNFGILKSASDIGWGTAATFGGTVGLAGGVSYFGTSLILNIPAVKAVTVTPMSNGLCWATSNC